MRCAGTRIFVSNRGWDVDTGAFFVSASSPEGTVVYTAPVGGAPAGTVVTLDTSGQQWPVPAGDTVLVFQGVDADTPSDFLWGYATSAWSSVQSFSMSELPADLGTW